MRKVLFILLAHPVLLGVLGAIMKWLTKVDDVAIIGSLTGLFIIGLAGILYENVIRGSGISADENAK